MKITAVNLEYMMATNKYVKGCLIIDKLCVTLCDLDLFDELGYEVVYLRRYWDKQGIFYERYGSK